MLAPLGWNGASELLSFGGEMKIQQPLNAMEKLQKDPFAPSPELPEQCGHCVLDRAAEEQPGTAVWRKGS